MELLIKKIYLTFYLHNIPVLVNCESLEEENNDKIEVLVFDGEKDGNDACWEQSIVNKSLQLCFFIEMDNIYDYVKVASYYHQDAHFNLGKIIKK